MQDQPPPAAPYFTCPHCQGHTPPVRLRRISTGGWITFGVLMLLFGAKKLPMLARGLGAGIRNFKGELQAPADDVEEDDR